MRTWRTTGMTARKMGQSFVYKVTETKVSDDGLEQTSTCYCMVSSLFEKGFRPVGNGSRMVWCNDD